MQAWTESPRHLLTRDQVVQLLQNEDAITLTGGLEIVDLDLEVVDDISDDLAGGSVERDNSAAMHGSAKFRISRVLDWGGDLLRPYLTVSGGGLSARFNLGVYHPTTPKRPVGSSLPTYEADGYDLLLRLAKPVGDAYAIAGGESYLAKVEEILVERGYTQYSIDQTAAGILAPTSRAWMFSESTTWLTIVNDLLGSIGYGGIWSDWNGWLRVEPYLDPALRGPEWAYADDLATTMLGASRDVEQDFFDAPNRWVGYRSNMSDGSAPVEGDGIHTITNQSNGPSSVDARRGLVIPRLVGFDVANQAALVVQTQKTAAEDMAIPVFYNTSAAPNPLHWHQDRMELTDIAAELQAVQVLGARWSLPLPPDTGPMTHQWRILA